MGAWPSEASVVRGRVQDVNSSLSLGSIGGVGLGAARGEPALGAHHKLMGRKEGGWGRGLGAGTDLPLGGDTGGA